MPGEAAADVPAVAAADAEAPAGDAAARAGAKSPRFPLVPRPEKQDYSDSRKLRLRVFRSSETRENICERVRLNYF